MIAQIPATHPYWHVKRIVEELYYIDRLSLSFYKYLPNTVADIRETFTIPSEEFIRPEIIADILSCIPEGSELALHSLVEYRDGSKLHIPMIDMSTRSSVQIKKLIPFLGEAAFFQMKWYKSGRSYHGYGSNLISGREWEVLLGVLLLANQKELPPTVDPRWIGHRLVAGYAALRWSKNTPHYLSFPSEIAKLI